MKLSVVDIATLLAVGCAVVLTAHVLRGPQLTTSQARPDREIKDWERYLEGGHRLGPDTAALTILEFGDYECPACRQFHDVLTRLRAEHPDEIAVVYRHWPLERHLYAYDAARAAECAHEQGRFWQYHELLFQNPRWIGEAFSEFARSAGLQDLESFERCMDRPAPVPEIEEDIRAVRELDGFGTPTILVNGVLLGSMPSLTELEDRLSEAKKR